MKPMSAELILRRSGVLPLVRSTRSQFEIDYLPPYGDPEVSIPGELATYTVVSCLAIATLDRLGVDR